MHPTPHPPHPNTIFFTICLIEYVIDSFHTVKLSHYMDYLFKLEVHNT